MKFLESQTSLDATSPMRFLRGVFLNFLFAPFKLTVEIARKVVFLPWESVKQLLAVAVGVGSAYTGGVAAVHVYLGDFSLLRGSFPLVFPLFSTLGLAIAYAVASSVNLFVYEHLEKLCSSGVLHQAEDVPQKQMSVKESEEQVPAQEIAPKSVETAATVPVPEEHEFVEVESGAREDVFTPEVAEPAGESADTFSGNVDITESEIEAALQDIEITNALDDVPEVSLATGGSNEYHALPNSEVFESSEIRDFQNRLRNKISDLSDYGKGATHFSDDEISLLEQEMEGVTDPSKFIDEELLKELCSDSFDSALSVLDELDLYDEFGDFDMFN